MTASIRASLNWSRRSAHTGADQFVAATEPAVGHPLTDEQATCLRDAYHPIDPARLDEALAAAVDPANANPDALAPFEQAYETCGL